MVVKVDKSKEFVKSGKVLVSEYPAIHPNRQKLQNLNENTKTIQNLQSCNQKIQEISLSTCS